MNMRVRDAAWRDRGDVRGQILCADILRGHALLVVNAIPIPLGAAATNGQYPIVIFYSA
jgi:hypothetical protein